MAATATQPPQASRRATTEAVSGHPATHSEDVDIRQIAVLGRRPSADPEARRTGDSVGCPLDPRGELDRQKPDGRRPGVTIQVSRPRRHWPPAAVREARGTLIARCSSRPVIWDGRSTIRAGHRRSAVQRPGLARECWPALTRIGSSATNTIRFRSGSRFTLHGVRSADVRCTNPSAAALCGTDQGKSSSRSSERDQPEARRPARRTGDFSGVRSGRVRSLPSPGLASSS